MRNIDVTPIEIRDFALALGWKLVTEALSDGLFVLNSPNNDYKQLIFPKDESMDSFEELAYNTIKKLSSLTNKSEFRLIEEIREVNEDVISLRYYSDSKSVNSLSFQEAIESIEGTKKLILSAATSVVNPTIYHKKLSRTEPNDLLKKVRFRHTEEGSFKLKISCPLEYDSPNTTDLFGETEINKPYARKTFELINRSAFEILNTIEADSIESFIEEQTNSITPHITYNFVEAISELFDEERELPFDLGFDWSKSSLGRIAPPSTPKLIRFPFSLKSKIDTVKNYLEPKSSALEDTFYGTVESLNGNIDNEGNRSGEVRIALIIDSSIVNVRVLLKHEFYTLADKAHMDSGLLVKIKGRLNPGKQIRLLDNISDFSIIEK